MRSMNRVLVKVAIVSALYGGIFGMPLGGSAAPSQNSCAGQILSLNAVEFVPPGKLAQQFGNNAGENNKVIMRVCQEG